MTRKNAATGRSGKQLIVVGVFAVCRWVCFPKPGPAPTLSRFHTRPQAPIFGFQAQMVNGRFRSERRRSNGWVRFTRMAPVLSTLHSAPVSPLNRTVSMR